ncbi:hypothetical protein FRB96_007260 [Tulasnella sp. 330]|nr:hypothetical protein FRB96_007260 [Tulasnella sp. 330]
MSDDRNSPPDVLKDEPSQQSSFVTTAPPYLPPQIVTMMNESTPTTEQPAPILDPTSNKRPFNIANAIKKVTTKDGWLGDYDFGWLCMPSLPFMRNKRARAPPFYAIDQQLPLMLAIICGLQHSLAMLAGLITPPIIFASALNLDGPTSSYMISASLISCGILSLVQMSRLHLGGRFYLGTGLITVVGTSFATLSTAFSIFAAMYKNGTCPTITNADGTTTQGPCPDAFGYLLGTSMVCSFLEMGLSFVPPTRLRKIFPPLVTGTVILMIGASLIGSSGVLNWGGGSNDCSSRPTTGIFELCPTIFAPRPLPWGSAQFLGLGFLSFVAIILTEIFGSPFLKNASIIVGLVVGCIVAGAAGYIDGSSITTAPKITFLWVHTFKIRVYPQAILPMLAVYISLAMEAIGDIAASADASRVAVDGPEFDSRIQGGVLADGVGGFLSALFTNPPLSIFAQNNGVWTRRDRFILAAALSFGVGDLLVPTWYAHLFDGVHNPSAGLQGLLDSITIILETPFLAAGIVAVLLNGILPKEDPRARAIEMADPEGQDNGVDHGQEHESADEKDKGRM